jgi:hypothetical protein
MEQVRVALDSDGSVTEEQIAAFAVRHGLLVDSDLGRVDEQIGVLEIREGMAVTILPIDLSTVDDGPTVAATAASLSGGVAAAGAASAAATGATFATGAAMAGFLPLVGAGLATAFVAQRLQRRQAEQRRRSGHRRGPRPHKPPRALIEQICSRLDDGVSYRTIADEMRARNEPTPNGGTWWPATVKRLIDTSLKETRIVLTRLGSLLADIDAAGSVTHDQLVDLGNRHKFHHRRLLEAFEAGRSAPQREGFTPPVERQRKRYVLSASGRRLLEVWRRSELLDDRVEDVALGLYRQGGTRGVSPAIYERVCSTAGVAIADVPTTYVEFRPETGAFHLTDEGVEVAQTWSQVVDRDPNKRLDIDFWPESHEETDRWDWEDDPLAPTAVKA